MWRVRWDELWIVGRECSCPRECLCPGLCRKQKMARKKSCTQKSCAHQPHAHALLLCDHASPGSRSQGGVRAAAKRRLDVGHVGRGGSFCVDWLVAWWREATTRNSKQHQAKSKHKTSAITAASNLYSPPFASMLARARRGLVLRLARKALPGPRSEMSPPWSVARGPSVASSWCPRLASPLCTVVYLARWCCSMNLATVLTGVSEKWWSLLVLLLLEWTQQANPSASCVRPASAASKENYICMEQDAFAIVAT